MGHFKAIDAPAAAAASIGSRCRRRSITRAAATGTSSSSTTISDKQIYDMLDEDGDQRVTFDEFWMFILNATAQREEGGAAPPP